LWLKATTAINEFTGDRVRAVVEALAPILVTGQTKLRFDHKRHPPRLAEGVDAADYQSPATTPPQPPGVPPPGQETTLRQMNATLWTDRAEADLAGPGWDRMLGVPVRLRGQRYGPLPAFGLVAGRRRAQTTSN
jgi:hypothetical protein